MLCTSIESLCVLLIFETYGDLGCGVEVVGGRVRDYTTICVMKGDVADAEEFCSAATGDVGVFAASASEKETSDEEESVCFQVFIRSRDGVVVDEQEVVWVYRFFALDWRVEFLPSTI